MEEKLFVSRGGGLLKEWAAFLVTSFLCCQLFNTRGNVSLFWGLGQAGLLKHRYGHSLPVAFALVK